MNAELDIILNIWKNDSVTTLPLLMGTLEQKWTYSHYIHGNVALKAGELSGQPKDKALQVATAVEVVWAAILLLDDIVDNDEVRYHIQSAWKQAGYGPATMEMLDGILSGIQIIEDHEVRAHLIEATNNTINAMRIIVGKPIDSPLSDLEPAFRELGALSAFSTSWPWRHPVLEEIAFYEACAGQLVNDCNDCFGPKAKRRNYPDLRNRQASLLFGILNTTNNDDLSGRVLAAENKAERAAIAQEIHSLLQIDSSKLFGVFDRWMDQAAELSASVKEIGIPVSVWLLERLNENRKMWRSKLIKLIERNVR